MRIRSFLVALVCCCGVAGARAVDLSMLDRAVERDFTAPRFARIDSLKRRLPLPDEKWDASMRLAAEYADLNVDSALSYALRARSWAPDHLSRRKAMIRTASIYNSSLMMYKEAADIFDSLPASGGGDPTTDADYYILGVQLYRNLELMTPVGEMRERYAAMKRAYRDSVLAIDPASLLIRANKLLDGHLPDEALHLLLAEMAGEGYSPANGAIYHVATVLTPENPEKVKVLSLNNSLIHYNDQDFVFNDIAAAEGADAIWTKHTNLGKPLSYHWEEGDGLAADGTPGAKMMIRSDAWSHIILQEQSSLPRTSPEKFRNSVEQWIGYIREYCPNPNAVIILPVNWAYSSDWSNFSDYNRQFIDIYTDVASELGCVVCPVAAAYDDIFRSEGSEVAGTLFPDDRHPTLPATYMAACMEYATIFGIDPAEITYVPEGVEASDAEKMRRYASRAIVGYNNAIDHLGRSIRFSAKVYDDFGIEMNVGKPEYSVDGGGSISEDGMFVADGTEGEFTVTARCGGFEKSSVVKVASHLTEVVTYPSLKLNEENLSASEDFDGMGADAEAALPEAWRIDRQTVGTRTIGTYATALTSTTCSGGVNLPSNAKNGVWNFGADDSSDRALGGITTGVANGSRAINLYTHLSNDGRKNVEKIRVSYDVEKYRKGNNQAGFAVQLHYSLDGRNWISAGDDFHTYLAPDQETAGYASVPGEVIPMEGVLPVDFGGGMDLYLAWNISVASGDAAQGAMALGIDNVKFEGQLPEVPQTDHRIYVDNRTSWDAIGLYAWGDGEIFGVWPGQAPIDELESEGTTWLVFGLDSAGGSYNLIFNNWNNNKQLPDFNITANRDYWLRIDDNGVTEIINTGVEEMEGAADGLRYDNGVLLSESPGEIRVYNMQGELLICGEGPALATDSLSRGLYIATSATAGALKFAVR